jgi:hypothetical protein
MGFDKPLGGRKDRRHPIMLAVDLAPLEGGSERHERTHTGNISAGGVRVHSTRPWQPGEQVEITPLKDTPAHGEVVYCQNRGQDEFFVAIKFRQSRLWTIFQTFGIAITGRNSRRRME